MTATKSLIIQILFISTTLSAQDWFDVPKESEVQSKPAEGSLTYAPSIRIAVPEGSGFRGKTLRVDGITYPLKQYVDLPSLYGDEEVEVEIVDADGRILDYQYRMVSGDMLRDFSVRNFHFRLAGGYRSTDNDKWKALGIRPSGPTLDFAIRYSQGRLGAKLGIQRLKRSGKNDADQLVEYESSETPIMLGYDYVPLPESVIWRQWQLRLWVGVNIGKHRLKTHGEQQDNVNNSTVVDDQKVQSVQTTGIQIGIESMRPITDRVWLTLAYDLIHRRLAFSDLDFATEKPVHDFRMGIYFSI